MNDISELLLSSELVVCGLRCDLREQLKRGAEGSIGDITDLKLIGHCRVDLGFIWNIDGPNMFRC